jgi:hypothetical protein
MARERRSAALALPTDMGRDGAHRMTSPALVSIEYLAQ